MTDSFQILSNLSFSYSLFQISYLPTLSVPTQSSGDDRTANECGAFGGMRIGSGTEVLIENQPQHNFEHKKSHMT
jgi:hypothetical protein